MLETNPPFFKELGPKPEVHLKKPETLSFDEFPAMEFDVHAFNLETPTFMAEQATLHVAKELAAKLSSAEKADALFQPKLDTNSLFGVMERTDEAERLQQFHDIYGAAITERLLNSSEDPEKIHGFIESAMRNPLPKEIVESFATCSPVEFEAAVTSYLDLDRIKDPLTTDMAAAQCAQEALAIPEVPVAEEKPKAKKPKSHFKTDWSDEEGEVARVGGMEIFEVSEADVDEADFVMNSDLMTRLPSNAESAESFEFGEGLAEGDLSVSLGVLKKIKGEMSPAESQAAEKIVTALQEWNNGVFGAQAEKIDALPDRAKGISIYHEQFGRSRKIPPFAKVLLKKMSGTVMGYALDAVNSGLAPDKAAAEAVRRADSMFDEALRMYQKVDEEGVPIFREFSQYLASQNQAQFHVGRDTMTTTFVASNALAWGRLPAQERRNLIRHINISRTVTEPLDYALLDPTTRERLNVSFKAYLDQQKINTTMTGVDGGYKGTNIESVIRSLNPDATDQTVDEHATLMAADTAYSQRQFRGLQTDAYYRNFVQSMERWPKFVERSQGVKQIGVGEFAKYYLVSKRRAESEQLLAWVVQHAVWRGTLPDDKVKMVGQKKG